MNTIIIPDDAESEPDELLAEFAKQGNRAAIIEEVYRRANGHGSGYEIAREANVDIEDIEAVADVAWREYRSSGSVEGDRLTMLEMSYGNVADHVFESVPGAEW